MKKETTITKYYKLLQNYTKYDGKVESQSKLSLTLFL